MKACLIAEARRHNVNISEVLGDALFQHLRQLRRERHDVLRSVETIFRGL